MTHHGEIPFPIILMLAFMIGGCQDPPLAVLEKAERALKLAAANGAGSYAPSKYSQAEKTLQAGRLEMARQKGKIPFFRNYHRADSLLDLACSLADKAAMEALEEAATLRLRAEDDLSNLRGEITSWREFLEGSLLELRAEGHLSAAELASDAAARLIIAEEFVAAVVEIENGRRSLAALGQTVGENNQNEKRLIRKWRAWVSETLSESRLKQLPAIIVDKSAHKLYLVRNGELFTAFNCEIGYNSVRQKLFAGDGATPEGKYQVTGIKNKGSKYYKALTINFPNQQDKRNFRENRKNGIISHSSRIGAHIEIHGDGGRGKDWTDGCVALVNDDIDNLIEHARVGTPVTIVRRSDLWP